MKDFEAAGLGLGLDLLTATIKDLQHALSDGKVTSVQLVQAYLVGTVAPFHRIFNGR
jgi:hypothetical protein